MTLPRIIVAAFAPQFQDGYEMVLKPELSRSAGAVVMEHGILDPYSTREPGEMNRLQHLLRGNIDLLVVLMTGMFEEEYLALNMEVPDGRRLRRMAVMSSSSASAWERLARTRDLCCVVNLGQRFPRTVSLLPELAIAGLLYDVPRLSCGVAQIIEEAGHAVILQQEG